MQADFKDEKYTYTPAIKNNDAIQLWFCFPSTYMVGMSSLGYLHLFRLFDENPEVAPERVFTDTKKTSRSSREIELMGFSFSFEFDFMGLFKILEKYEIPFRAKDRGDDFPLIFGGGPVLTANPEPFADFFDFIIIGEGEEILDEIVQAYKKIRGVKNKPKQKGFSDLGKYELTEESVISENRTTNSLPTYYKRKKLLELSKVEGIYTPSFYEPEYNPDKTIKKYAKLTEDAPERINKRYIKNLQKSIGTPIVAKKAVFPNMFMIETARGCPKRCRFCIASYLTLPARYPRVEAIKNAVDAGLEYSDKIGLLGALIAEHPNFEEICRHILERREEKEFGISVSSLRVDTITPLIIETLVKCGQKQNTIAIEAGTERLRKVINKNLNEEAIFKGVKIAHDNGLKGLKIYGMLGLPTETEEDIKQLAALMIRLKKENKGFNLTLSSSSFVPKAGTPFQWSERAKNNILESKNNYLRKELNLNKIIYKPTSIKWDYIQAVLSRGDRRLSRLLEAVYAFGGTLGSWNRAYREIGEILELPNFEWYGLRKRSYEEILPWSLINTGIKTDTLIQESKKAISKS